MPLVGFRPTKARLVIEDSSDTILVMKVVVADSESVELASGGKLDALAGVVRIRERKHGYLVPRQAAGNVDHRGSDRLRTE